MNNVTTDVIAQITLYAYKEINDINHHIQTGANRAFRNLHIAYARNDAIAQFMPARPLSSRTTVLQTANLIFHFGRMTSQDISEDLNPKNLQSILKNAEDFLESKPSRSDYWNDTVVGATIEGDLLTIRALSAIGLFASEEFSSPLYGTLQTHRGNIAQLAAHVGETQILQIVLASGEISGTQKMENAFTAIEQGHLSSVQAVLANGGFDEETTEQILMMAGSHRQLAIVQAMSPGIEMRDISRVLTVLEDLSHGHRPTAAFAFLVATRCLQMRPCFGGAAVAALVQACFATCCRSRQQ